MSFLTEYFDEYRQHPIRKTKLCNPESRFATFEGKWLDPKVGASELPLSDEDVQAFIKATMKSMRGQSSYYNHYCAHLDPVFKTRPFVPKKKKNPCEAVAADEEAVEPEVAPPLAMKDTELMKVAQALYEPQAERLVLTPLPTHFRILGYSRPCLYRTGISEYTNSIARLAYEMVRDSRIPKYRVSNGNRPQWGIPPEGTRQPMLDGIPFNSERRF